MEKIYSSFLKHTNSHIIKGNNPYRNFETYFFSSEIGTGYTAIYSVDSYADICITDHIYYSDFKYAVPTEEGIYFQQYDSIDSERKYYAGRVYAGMQYLTVKQKPGTVCYVIKKKTPARVIGVQLKPEYYRSYLKKMFGIEEDEFSKKIAILPKEIRIPEISLILNQIRTFTGSSASTKLFFKSKVDEIASLLLQKSDAALKSCHSITKADHEAIMMTIEYIHSNLSKKLSLKQLANMSYMSPSKFKYVFKAVTGLTLGSYMLNTRMEKACVMLCKTNMYVANIAQSLGYSNTGYFSARFKEYTGLLPNEYRCR